MKITGLKVIKKKIIKIKKGDIIKFVDKKDKFFKRFGEIYFSEIIKNQTKGWNLHKRNICIISVPFGRVLFNFVDGRKKNSFQKEKIVISKKKHKVIVIPPGVWFSFKSLTSLSIVANCLSNIHSDKETKKSEQIYNIKIR